MDLFQPDRNLTDSLMKNHKYNHGLFDGTAEQEKIKKEILRLRLSGATMPLVAHITSPSIGDYSFFVTKRYLDQMGEDYRTFYLTNQYGFRCDNFSAQHEGPHILFAGCSLTYGESVPQELSWAQILYNKIAEEIGASGYFNIGTPGASMTDIIDLVRAYSSKYGVPDHIFILFPNLKRDKYQGIQVAKGLNKDLGTRIYAMTWDRHCSTSMNNKLAKDHREKVSEIEYLTLIDHKDLYDHIYRYQLDYSGKYNDFLLKGMDDAHPGIAEHDFYANRFYDIWKSNV